MREIDPCDLEKEEKEKREKRIARPHYIPKVIHIQITEYELKISSREQKVWWYFWKNLRLNKFLYGKKTTLKRKKFAIVAWFVYVHLTKRLEP